MKRICQNCKKEIQEKEHYFEVIERSDKEIISIKYVHKKCQDNYDEKLKNALSPIPPQLIKGMKEMLERIVPQEKVYEIK